jgi:hypothetical protein
VKSTPLILEAPPGHATYELGWCCYDQYHNIIITGILANSGKQVQSCLASQHRAMSPHQEDFQDHRRQIFPSTIRSLQVRMI